MLEPQSSSILLECWPSGSLPELQRGHRPLSFLVLGQKGKGPISVCRIAGIGGLAMVNSNGELVLVVFFLNDWSSRTY